MDFASSTRAAENKDRKGLSRSYVLCLNDLIRLGDKIQNVVQSECKKGLFPNEYYFAVL